jgi:hypothetical protein
VTVELQVRTVFEEAWSEIDHRVNYPEGAPFREVGRFLQVFNRLAGSADEMGSFIHDLVRGLTALKAQVEAAEAERQAASARADDLVGKLAISSDEKKQLRRELQSLSESRARPTNIIGQIVADARTVRIPSPSEFSIGWGSTETLPLGMEGAGLNITASYCPHCGYGLRGGLLSGPACPSCGRAA